MRNKSWNAPLVRVLDGMTGLNHAPKPLLQRHCSFAHRAIHLGIVVGLALLLVGAPSLLQGRSSVSTGDFLGASALNSSFNLSGFSVSIAPLPVTDIVGNGASFTAIVSVQSFNESLPPVTIDLSCLLGCTNFSISFGANSSTRSSVPVGGSTTVLLTPTNSTSLVPGGSYVFQALGSIGSDQYTANDSIQVVSLNGFALALTPPTLALPYFSTTPEGFAVTAVRAAGFVADISLSAACDSGCGSFSVSFVSSSNVSLAMANGSYATVVVTPSSLVPPVPGQVYRFGISGTGGNITQQVNGSFTVDEFIGIRSTIDVSGQNFLAAPNGTTDSCANFTVNSSAPGFRSCYSVQQDFLVNSVAPGVVTQTYWVRAGIVLALVSGRTWEYVAPFFAVYNVSGNPSTPVYTPLSVQIPTCLCTNVTNFAKVWAIQSVLVSGSLLVNTTLGDFSWSIPGIGPSNSSSDYIVSKMPLANGTGRPEILLTGAPTSAISAGDGRAAEFVTNVTASIFTAYKLLGNTFSADVSQSPAYAGATTSPDSSGGLFLGVAQKGVTQLSTNLSACPADNTSLCALDGVLMAPEASTVVESGTAFQYLAFANSSVSLFVANSSAANGTSLNISGVQLTPGGNITNSTNNTVLAEFDLAINGTGGGETRTCVNGTNLSSAVALEYFNGSGWNNASGFNASGNSSCGTIPVSALNGSLVALLGATGHLIFTESGLPRGTAWTVMVGHTPHRTTLSSFSLPLPRGTYTFTTSTTGKFGVSIWEGHVLVGRTPTVIQLSFRAFTIRSNLAGLSFMGWNLAGLNFTGDDLAGAHLSATNLAGADFGAADLKSANLSGTFAPGSNWKSANLQSTRFVGATLVGAHFDKADLKSANFEHANLMGTASTPTSFAGANLQKADFRYALTNGYLITTGANTKSSQTAGCIGSGCSRL